MDKRRGVVVGAIFACVCARVWKQRKESDTEGYCCISSLSSCLAAENQWRRLLSGLLTSTSQSAQFLLHSSSHPCLSPLLLQLPFPFSFASILLFISPARISVCTCVVHTCVCVFASNCLCVLYIKSEMRVRPMHAPCREAFSRD